MIFPWNFQLLFLYLILEQINFHYVITTWPSSNVSSIQFLGLFIHDDDNRSQLANLSVHSLAMFKSAILLSQQYNITINGQYIEWRISQTNGNIINVLSSVCRAISNSTIVGIVGPVFSREAHIIAPFGKTVGIPVISYAATDSDLSDRDSYPTFYRTVPSDNTIALAIAKLFIRFNWTSCVIIHQNDAFGSGGAKVISDTFVNHGLLVKHFIVFNIATKKVRDNLKTLLTSSSTRIVIVWAETSHTILIVQEALDSDVVGPHFTWILSSRIPLTSFNQLFHRNLIGILTVEPGTGAMLNKPINITLLNAAYQIWKQYEPESFPGPMKVSNYALFAFDATWSLIQSLQQLCSSIEYNYSSSSCLSFNGSSDCFNRRFVHSDILFNLISRTEFLGVSGPMRFSSNTTDRINGLYYYVRNVQSTEIGVDFIPVLKYVPPNEWKAFRETNVIVWPGITLTPPSGRATLVGVTLRIGVIELPPFTTVINVTDPSGIMTTKLIGYMIDLIELLQEQMKFIPDIQLAPSNQTYHGLIEAVTNGVYDIVVADIAITSKRRQKVDFSDTIFDSSLRIMVRREINVDIDLLSYLRPFSLNLWLLILASTIYATVLIYLLERSENEELEKRSTISAIAMSFWFSFSNIVGYGADFHAKTAAGRLLTAGLYILSLVIVASYTANLASNLTISKSKDILSGVDDIKNGKIPFHRIGLQVGTSIEDYYLREISRGNINFYPTQSPQELYDALLMGNIDAAIIDISSAEYATKNIYCNLTLIGAEFYRTGVGIVIPRQWLYKQDLDVNILSLKEAGKLDNLKAKWFQSTICSATTETTTAMKMRTMGGLFLTFIVITMLSLLIFLWKKRFIIRNYLFGLVARKTIPKWLKNTLGIGQQMWMWVDQKLKQHSSETETESNVD